MSLLIRDTDNFSPAAAIKSILDGAEMEQTLHQRIDSTDAAFVLGFMCFIGSVIVAVALFLRGVDSAIILPFTGTSLFFVLVFGATRRPTEAEVAVRRGVLAEAVAKLSAQVPLR